MTRMLARQKKSLEKSVDVLRVGSVEHLRREAGKKASLREFRVLERCRPPFPTGRRVGWQDRTLRPSARVAALNLFSIVQTPFGRWTASGPRAALFFRRYHGARSGFRPRMERACAGRHATFPGNRLTNCEPSRSGRSRADAMRSSQGIFSLR